jgi:hypothetical protein
MYVSCEIAILVGKSEVQPWRISESEFLVLQGPDLSSSKVADFVVYCPLQVKLVIFMFKF